MASALPRPTVVILLSDKRSGSTIFQTELAGHPDVQPLKYTSHTYLESHHWLKAAVMLGKPARMFSGGKIYPGYGGARNARSYMIDTIFGNLPDFVPPHDDRELIFDGWEALCAAYAKPVFFEKSPQILANWAALSLLLEWRARTDFDVRLVGLVRNPLAVQHSSERLFGTSPELRQFGWADLHRNLLALRQMLPDSALKIVRHEDILNDPVTAFADICTFVGLPPDPAMGASITDKTQDRWRTDAGYRLRLDPSVRQVAQNLGYTDADLDNPHAVPEGTPIRPSRRQWRPIQSAKNTLRDRVIKPILIRRRLPSNRR